MQYDVFICHASDDKDDFVRPLAERLRQQNLDVWYDEFSLQIGDSLTQKIDEGLSNSRFGIVILSHIFFKKPWAKRELKGLISREMNEKRDLILTILHKVGVQDVMKFSPPLADKIAGTSSEGISSLIRKLTKKIKPDDSPLIVARNDLAKLNVDIPPISDEWWLDVVEHKEYLKDPDINVGIRWLFPLPFQDADRGLKRGHNIASAALQIDWSFEGETLNISPTTHPEIVHEFIHRWPGLYDCAKANPNVLALYAPQLTIPGFDSGFEDEFDELLKPENNKANLIVPSIYGHNTVDGNKPLCRDIIAYRHPEYGNYTAETLGHLYFINTLNTRYTRSNWDIFEGLVWLVSSDSDWLPKKLRNVLIIGICHRHRWADYNNKFHNPFIDALWDKNRKQFKLTKKIQNGLNQLVTSALEKLKITQNSKEITERLLGIGLVEKFYDYKEEREKR